MVYNFDNLIANLSKLIQIDSTESTALLNMPFGEGCTRALEFALGLASDMGFETINHDNYIGEIVWGEGEEFAILCHLDVVPCGDLSKWTYPPFSATVANGYMFGRGTCDDKGPFIATLYALKRLKDSGFMPKKQIRLIVGLDEESGWGCIEHYKSVRNLPKTGFSPDAHFPVIYAEKGLYHIEYAFDFNKEKLFDITAGVAPNVVCDKCVLTAEINESVAKECGLTTDQNTLVSVGKTAHASQPELGKNALKNVFEYLGKIGAINRVIGEYLFDDKLQLTTLKDGTGSLTFSPNMARIENDKLLVTVDIRYPATANFLIIDYLLKDVGTFSVLSHHRPLYNDPNSPLIQTLLKVYNKHSGENAQPIAIGGGTYSRALELCAGFGPEGLCGESMSMHQPDEKISLSTLKKLVDIYTDAVFELTK